MTSGAVKHNSTPKVAAFSAPHPRLLGLSVLGRSSSNSSRRKMATGVNHQQGPLEGPSHNYPSPGEAHSSHGAYYDHPAQRTFEDEEDMHMANTLSQGMQHNIGAQLVNAAGLSNGHGHDQEMRISPPGVGAPGMAPPPQTPTQAAHVGPPAQQSGAEGIQDQGAADSTRRKRSKVSRACDECRRKKVAKPIRRFVLTGFLTQFSPRFDAMPPLKMVASRPALTATASANRAPLAECP
jgi:hypothetical protein